jgi:hypothetical protein
MRGERQPAGRPPRYVGNHASRPFTDADEALCGCQNASLFIRERRLRTEAEVVAALASQVTASLDVDQVLASRTAVSGPMVGEITVIVSASMRVGMGAGGGAGGCGKKEEWAGGGGGFGVEPTFVI